MNKKWFVIATIGIFCAFYYFLFYKDYKSGMLPKNTYKVVALDTKNIQNFYLKELLKNPNNWDFSFFEDDDEKDKIEFLKSGIRIPDFIFIYTLKDSKVGEWYAHLQLKNKEKFIHFLKQNGFTKNSDFYEKKETLVLISDDYFSVVLHSKNKEKLKELHHEFLENTAFDVSNYWDKNPEISMIDLGNKQQTNVYFSSNEILVNDENIKSFKSDYLLDFMISKGDYTKVVSQFNVKSYMDSIKWNSIYGTISSLEQKVDTVISYEFDDDFNEIEKKTTKKVYFPNYSIEITSNDSESIINNFSSKNWIDQNNQFTKIPFLPNTIEKDTNSIFIFSHQKKKIKKDFSYMNINANLLDSIFVDSFSSLDKKEKIIINSLENIHLRVRNGKLEGKISFVKKTPWILLK
ncbi:MAG: hypothetical protein H6604_05125 [Flavobacteriales bacterium]|nr:hypothetical protein [Flavobacteriales bacterium]